MEPGSSLLSVGVSKKAPVAMKKYLLELDITICERLTPVGILVAFGNLAFLVSPRKSLSLCSY